MPIVVEVKTQADYDKWLAAQKEKYGVGRRPPLSPSTARCIRATNSLRMAKTVYEGAGGCQGCHQPTGKGVPGTFPALDGSKVVNERKKPRSHCCLTANRAPRWLHSSI